MLVRFLYTDHSIWDGPPEDAHKSPDPRPPDGGIIRMTAIDDFGREVAFLYDDFYYLHPVDGGWRFGSSSPKREFDLKFGRDGAIAVPSVLPEDAVIRYGCEVSHEEAIELGLIDEGGKLLTPPREVIVIEKSGAADDG